MKVNFRMLVLFIDGQKTKDLCRLKTDKKKSCIVFIQDGINVFIYSIPNSP